MELGSLKRMVLELQDNPKFDIDMDNIGPITILVGKNGTGKTFVLKTSWILTMICNSKITNTLEKEFINYTFSKTFHDCESITGTIEGYYSCGTVCKIELYKGECVSFDITIAENVDEHKIPIYMSSQTRLFSNIDVYLTMRKGIIGHLNQPRTEDLSKFAELLNSYSLPDYMFLEMRLKSALEGMDIAPEISEMLVKNYDFPYYPIKMVFYDDKIQFLTKEGKLENPCKLGAGHQSILNIVTTM